MIVILQSRFRFILYLLSTNLFAFVQEELYEMINKRYADFLPNLQGSEKLMMQVDEVSKEMDALKNCIENEVRLVLKHTTNDG